MSSYGPPPTADVPAYTAGFACAAAQAFSAAARHLAENALSSFSQMRAHWAAVAATFSVAAVDGGHRYRGCGS